MKIKIVEAHIMFIPCSGRVNIIKMCTLPKAIYRCNAIPTKTPMMYFTKLERILQKFIRNHKMPYITTAILKNSKVGGITLPNMKLYYKAIVIKTAWYWYKKTHRSMEQNKKTRNKPYLYSQLIFNRGSKNIKWAKHCLVNKWC